MMKIYICPNCGWIRMVSRRKDVECFKCGTKMTLTNLEFEKYTKMTLPEREDYVAGWMYIHNRRA